MDIIFLFVFASITIGATGVYLSPLKPTSNTTTTEVAYSSSTFVSYHGGNLHQTSSFNATAPIPIVGYANYDGGGAGNGGEGY
jgi:hypothetical protein